MAEMARMTAAQLADKLLSSEHADVLRESVAWMLAELMEAEVAAQIGAELGERTPERLTHRNDYRSRGWETRVGELELRIPRLRTGSYFPSFLAPRRRALPVPPAVQPRWLAPCRGRPDREPEADWLHRDRDHLGSPLSFGPLAFADDCGKLLVELCCSLMRSSSRSRKADWTISNVSTISRSTEGAKPGRPCITRSVHQSSPGFPFTMDGSFWRRRR
jgi:hypothetical protein